MRDFARTALRLLALAALLSQASPRVRARAPEGGAPAPAPQFASGQSSGPIPFELVGNFVFLRASVNDSAPLWFLLDTGATASYLDAGRARAFSGAQGDALRGATLGLRGVRLPGQDFSLRPLRFGIYSGHAVDGLLGYDFISRFVVEIDYARRTIVLSAPQAYRHAGRGEVIPLTMLEDDSGGKVPLVRGSVTLAGRATVEGMFIADTAVRSAVSFNTPFVESKGLLRLAGRTIDAPLGGGAVVRESRQPVGRVRRLGLGRFEFKNPVAIFFRAQQGVLASPEFDGVIGAEILRRFKVVFDYSRRRLILEPDRHFSEPEEYDMSGMLLAAEGAGFDTFTVRGLVEGSPAAAAGLREGDVVTAVDGEPASNLTLEQLRKMLRQKGRTYRLGVRRGGRELRATLKLRRLI